MYFFHVLKDRERERERERERRIKGKSNDFSSPVSVTCNPNITCFDSYLNRNPLHLMWGLEMGGSQLVHRIVRGFYAYQNVSNCAWDRNRVRVCHRSPFFHFVIDIIFWDSMCCEGIHIPLLLLLLLLLLMFFYL